MMIQMRSNNNQKGIIYLTFAFQLIPLFTLIIGLIDDCYDSIGFVDMDHPVIYILRKVPDDKQLCRGNE